MNTITQSITPELVAHFYNPNTDGMIQLKGTLFDAISPETLQRWYADKRDGFERKDEKYIENNQRVSLVFNGPFSAIDTFDASHEIGLHNLYRTIRNTIAQHSDIPFKQGDRLETKLILYPISQLGVGAHKDLSSNINAIVIMNIYGTTTFYTSSDKNRNNEKAYTVEPGDIMIMRGPRSAAENDMRPIHYVLDVTEERLVFVCREIEDATERIINKDNWMGF